MKPKIYQRRHTNPLFQYLTIATTVVLMSGNFLYAQSLAWAQSYGGTGYDAGNAITLGPSKNIYITGSTSNNLDIYLGKKNTAGSILWSNSSGSSSGFDSGNSVVVDNSGNIYVAGTFELVMDFDPGPGVYNIASNGSEDVFIAKYDPSGNYLWAKSFGSPNADFVQNISLDGFGNLYIAGSFSLTADFDPSSGLASGTSVNGSRDFYISKFDTSGNFIWSRQVGGTGFDTLNSLYLDNSGNIYSVGLFTGTVNFNPGIGSINLTSVGSSDIFIAKFDFSGNILWAKQLGGSFEENATSLAIDKSGNILVTGSFNGQVDFDPGPGSYQLSSRGNSDIFVLKLSSVGHFQWAKTFGGIRFDNGSEITTDGYNNIYTIGFFDDQVDFDPGVGVQIFNANSVYGDSFVQKLDPSGQFVWVFILTSISRFDFVYGNDILVDEMNDIYITGSFEGNVDFDPGPGTQLISSPGNTDIFIQKLNQCVIDSTITVSTCVPYTLYGQTYTQSGIYSQKKSNITPGCDANITLDLTIQPIYVIIDTIGICSGESHTFPNGITLNNIQAPITVTSNLSTSVGCDSVIATTLEVSPVYEELKFSDVCEGSSFVFPDGSMLDSITSPVTYASNLQTATGCDSTVVTQLSVLSVDSDLLANNDTLRASAANATYQWLDCNNGLITIPGEISQTYIPPGTGQYAVAVTQNGCTDTSTCYSVLFTKLDNVPGKLALEIYPNPTTSEIYVEMAQPYKKATLSISDLQGKTILIEKTANQQSTVLDLSPL